MTTLINTNNTTTTSVLNELKDATITTVTELATPVGHALANILDIGVETVKMGAGSALVVTSHTKAAMEEINEFLPKNQQEAQELVERNKARFSSLFDTDEDTESTEKPRVRVAS